MSTSAARATAIQFIKFGLVGVINTGVDWVVFFGSHYWLGVHYLIAQILGFSFGAANSFVMNNYFTFGQGTKLIGRQVIRFAILTGASLGLSTLLLYIGELVGLSIPLSKIAVTIIMMILNYLFTKKWVFAV